jgi:Transposase and inactivated derivatives
MWTSRNRCRYERKGLRYPTDLTDAEWALVAPHIRAAKRGGRPRTTNMREVTNAILYILGTGVSGALCQRISRREPQSSSISICGNGMAPWGGCTMRSSSPRASRRTRKPARRPRSSTAKASRAPKKGGADRPVGL